VLAIDTVPLPLTAPAGNERCDVSNTKAVIAIGAAVIAISLAGGLTARGGVTTNQLRSNAPPYMTPTPSKNVTALVVIDDKGITHHTFRQLGEGSSASLETLPGPVPLGNLVTFNIYNRGKSVHNFAIFGKKTATIKPGRNTHLYFKVTSQGKFLYQSTLDKSKAFQGYLTVR
jgi:hypothetical protein